MANGDSRRISTETMRARAAALGLPFAADDRAARELAERLAAAAEDAERMSELGLSEHEPAVEFRPPTERKSEV